MGGFSILSREFLARAPRSLETVLATARRGGLGAPIAFTHDRYAVHYFPKQQAGFKPAAIAFPNGDFILAAGTLFHDGNLGRAALERIYAGYDGTRSIVDACRGAFALVICRDGNITLFNDPLGVYPVFYDREFRAAGSAFLPIARALPRVSLAPQGVYEYVFNGVVSGNDSIVDEIGLLPLNAKLELGARRVLACGSVTPPTETLAVTHAAAVEGLHEILLPYFETIASLFGDRVGCALSGGYDSRLLVAFLRAVGVAPHLSVYGKKEEEDIGLALAIAEGEGLCLDIIDKEIPLVPPEEFAWVVEDNFFTADGYGWDGFFDNGAELRERRNRVAGGTIALNGGAGEIMRNFFYLRGRAYTPREIVWSFYSRFDPRTCGAGFDEEQYFRAMERKIGELVGAERERLSRVTIDWLYHLFRCRSWDGRANAVNGKFGYTALPFLDAAVTGFACRIPSRLKNHGAIEAALIARIDPRLASFVSVYGHSFDRPPPLSRRVHDYLTYLRPPSLRRVSFRFQHRLGRARRHGPYVAAPFVAAALPGELATARRFFDLDAVRDGGQWARILSLEYLARRLGIST